MTRIKTMALDIGTMSKRCITMSLRNTETILTSAVTPILMMLLFTFVLGGSMDVGETSYVNYIVPGIILQSIGQCMSSTAIGLCKDIKNGIIGRFRSMPITQSSILTGHVVESILRCLLATASVIAVAFLIGFRPEANMLGWLAVIALLLLYSFALSWLSILFGLAANSPEGAGSLAVLVAVLPYLSSGFVSTDKMPAAIGAFAKYQPMTSIIESIRCYLFGQPLENHLLSAVLWCIVIFLASYIAAAMIYKKKLLA